MPVIDTALITRDTDIDPYIMGIGASTQNDTLLGLLITACSGAISRHCQRVFTQDTYTEYYDGPGSPNIYLRNWPVTSPVTGLWADTESVFPSSSLLTEQVPGTAGDFVVYTEEHWFGRVAMVGDGCFLAGRRNIKVTYQGGYATIPDPIKQACREYVAYAFKFTESGMHAAQQQSIGIGGGGSISTPFDRMMPPHVKQLLDPWRRRVVRM